MIRLVPLPAAVVLALADGDLVTANRHAPVVLTPWFVATESVSSWRHRRDALRADPAAEQWGASVVVADGAVVGRAGFHGPPDAEGRVEIAYAIAASHRRQGYARAALSALLVRARADPAVRTVRATIRPDNAASRALVAAAGFVAVGEQWDDEDGVETIFELSV